MTNVNTDNIKDILKQVQTLLNAKRDKCKVQLQVTDSGYTVDDDWINIVVTPKKEGVRAYDYVQVLSEVERELREKGIERVLLVPAIAD